MAPFDLSALGGGWLYYSIFLVIGMGFGAVLEQAGFGDSRKLSGQFYLGDMTVLKVMFTGIIVAMVLIFGATSLELLDYAKVWVNPTYMWPGIVGGLIMGVGFIVGGFCPGTSLAGAATLKIDAIFFVAGGLFGVFLFGETVSSFSGFWLSSYMGRFTIPEWLGLPYGVVVVMIVFMALAMFYGAEISEAYFGAGRKTGLFKIKSRGHVLAAVALVAVAAAVMVKGQPTTDERWRWISAKAGAELDGRAVFSDPREVVELKKDLSVYVNVIDLRSEADFNRFHLEGARRVPASGVEDAAFVRELLGAPEGTITFLVANGEAPAVEAWKRLRALGALNLYIIDGGINRWLELYPLPACVAEATGKASGADPLNYAFRYAVGERAQSAHPQLDRREPLPAGCPMPDVTAAHGEHVVHATPPAPAYTKKVKLQKKTSAKGGCG
jgi:hypothetical protein